ncbi:MAG: hypothetical protein HOF85_15470 [Acidiferrobacteraceae bacterium]|nr:hypothetical protein [Acidiferrobacteraceae bacterium]
MAQSWVCRRLVGHFLDVSCANPGVGGIVAQILSCNYSPALAGAGWSPIELTAFGCKPG